MVCTPAAALAQTQPAPTAKQGTSAIPRDTTPTSIFTAPAGGGYGPGIAVSPDNPFPTADQDLLDALNTPATSIPPLTPTADTTLGVAPAASTSAEACHVFKASAGNVYSLSGYVDGAAFIMVFNATSAPADGAVTPVVWAYAAVAGTWSLDYGAIPAAFSTGVTVCRSSTGPLTKTAVSTNTVFAGRVK
jgi:hypothetical protein